MPHAFSEASEMHGVCFSFQKKIGCAKATCRTCQSHMRFGSPPKCTWLCFFFGGNSRVCCSSQEGLVRADNATHRAFWQTA